MITAMVRSKLLATSGVTTLVSTRVYIDAIPSTTTTLPAIFVSPVSRVPAKQYSKGWEARVQVSCWSNPATAGGSRSPSEVENVAAAVTAALHKPRLNNAVEKWTVGSASYNIISRYVTGGTRRMEDPSGWYHVPVDVTLVYQEV
ncbi:MAG: DUF3168 domain-containing protein [Methanoregula sp.]|jgi:hypothetical protein|nr:DUF3168 domain-containing protein [Methanoregula sp.]